MAVVFAANTNELLLSGLRSQVSSQFLNAAAVTVTVKGLDGVAVGGASWPMSMTYVAGSDGDYRAILDDTIDFVVGVEYAAHIDVNAGANQIAYWKYSFICRERVES